MRFLGTVLLGVIRRWGRTTSRFPHVEFGYNGLGVFIDPRTRFGEQCFIAHEVTIAGELKGAVSPFQPCRSARRPCLMKINTLK